MSHDCPDLVRLARRYVRSPRAARDAMTPELLAHVTTCAHPYCSDVEIDPDDDAHDTANAIAHFALYEG